MIPEKAERSLVCHLAAESLNCGDGSLALPKLIMVMRQPRQGDAHQRHPQHHRLQAELKPASLGHQAPQAVLHGSRFGRIWGGC